MRLWVASSDYRQDMRISKDMLKHLSQNYLKIRNTARYILGNLFDFDPKTNAVAYADMPELDKWALMKLNDLAAKVREGYDSYEFHTVFHAIHNFCVVDMSNFYLDVIKDRLYCDETDGLSRRCCTDYDLSYPECAGSHAVSDPVLYRRRNLAGYAARS